MVQYVVQGRQVDIDPGREYLFPTQRATATQGTRQLGSAYRFELLDIEGFLRSLDGLAGLDRALGAYSRLCEDAIMLVASTQHAGETAIEEEGYATPPAREANTGLLEGLRNTAGVLKQLRRS